MDFVAFRAGEKAFGWRNRVGEFLRRFGVMVFDPWFKPEVRGFHQYGREDDKTSAEREKWGWRLGPKGAAARAECSERFWPSLHIDLRMVDTSDFIVAYCPTNIYSVGTPHEIVLARQQRKPVLFVSPHVYFPSLQPLRDRLKGKDPRALRLLERLEQEVPIKPNPGAIPSSWYMPLVGGEHFFDGFGFSQYRKLFGWPRIPLDKHEDLHPPQKPLLPFLEQLNQHLPKKWGRISGRFVRNEDWLLWDLRRRERRGAQWRGAHS